MEMNRLRAYLEDWFESTKLIYPVLVSFALACAMATQEHACEKIAEKYHGEVTFCYKSLKTLWYLACVNLVLISAYSTWKQGKLLMQFYRSAERERLLGRKNVENKTGLPV